MKTLKLSNFQTLKLLLLFTLSPFHPFTLSAAVTTNSNVVTVKAWARDDIMFDDATGSFSTNSIPSAAESAALEAAADELDELYALSIANLETNLAPVRARIDEARHRPVVTLALASAPENAVDRQNLTMCVLSNEIRRVDGGLACSFWVFGNNVLVSDPVMVASVLTDLGRTTNEVSSVWDGYGTNGVTVVDGGEEYECYRLDLTIPGEVKDGIDVLVMPWVRIGRRDKGFDFGNRQCRINGVMCLTTNDVSFLGTFMTTNGIDITDLFTPYVDRGLFRLEQKEELPE